MGTPLRNSIILDIVNSYWRDSNHLALTSGDTLFVKDSTDNIIALASEGLVLGNGNLPSPNPKQFHHIGGVYPYKQLAGLTLETFMYTLLSHINTYIKENIGAGDWDLNPVDMFHIWLCFASLVIQTNRYILKTYVIDPLDAAGNTNVGAPADIFMDYSLKTQYDRFGDANTSLWYLDFSHTNSSGEPTHIITSSNTFGATDTTTDVSTETTFGDHRVRTQFAPLTFAQPTDSAGNKQYFFDINILLCPIGAPPSGFNNGGDVMNAYLGLFSVGNDMTTNPTINTIDDSRTLLVSLMAEMSSKLNKMIVQNQGGGYNRTDVKMPHTLAEFQVMNQIRLHREIEGNAVVFTDLIDSTTPTNRFKQTAGAEVPTLGQFVNKFTNGHSSGLNYSDFQARMSRETFGFHVQPQTDDAVSELSSLTSVTNISIISVFEPGFLNNTNSTDKPTTSINHPFNATYSRIYDEYINGLNNSRDESFADESVDSFEDGSNSVGSGGVVDAATPANTTSLRELRMKLALGFNNGQINGFDLDALDKSAIILTNANRFVFSEWQGAPTVNQFTLSYIMKAIFAGTFYAEVNEIYNQFLVKAISNISTPQTTILNLMYSLYNVFDIEASDPAHGPPNSLQFHNVNIEFLINTTEETIPIDVTGAFDDETIIDHPNFAPDSGNFSYYIMIMIRLYTGSVPAGDPISVTGFIEKFMQNTVSVTSDLDPLLSLEGGGTYDKLQMDENKRIKASTQILYGWDLLSVNAPTQVGYEALLAVSNMITPDNLLDVYTMMTTGTQAYITTEKPKFALNMVYDYFRSRPGIPISGNLGAVFKYFQGSETSTYQISNTEITQDQSKIRHAIEVATSILEDAITSVSDGALDNDETLLIDLSTDISIDDDLTYQRLHNNINTQTGYDNSWRTSIAQMVRDILNANGQATNNGSLLMWPTFQSVILDNIKHSGDESLGGVTELTPVKKLELLSIYREFLPYQVEDLDVTAPNSGSLVRFINYLPVLRDTIVRDVYRVEDSAGDAEFSGEDNARIVGLNYSEVADGETIGDVDVVGLEAFDAYFNYNDAMNEAEKFEMWLNHMYFLKMLVRFTKDDESFNGEHVFSKYVGDIGSVQFLNQMKTLINDLWGSETTPGTTDFWINQNLFTYLSTLYAGENGWQDDTGPSTWYNLRAGTTDNIAHHAKNIVGAGSGTTIADFFPTRTTGYSEDLAQGAYGLLWNEVINAIGGTPTTSTQILHAISLLNKEIYSENSLLYSEANSGETILNFFTTDDTGVNSVNSGVAGTMIEYVMLGLNTRDITGGWYPQFRNTSFIELPFPLQLLQLYANYKMYLEPNSAYNLYTSDGEFVGNQLRAGTEGAGNERETYNINVDTFDEFVVYLFFAPRNRQALGESDDAFFANVEMLTELNISEYTKQYPLSALQKQITVLRSFMRPGIITRNVRNWSDNTFEETMSDIRFKLAGLERPINNEISLEFVNNLLTGPTVQTFGTGGSAPDFEETIDVTVGNASSVNSNQLMQNITNIEVTKYNASSVGNNILKNYFNGTFDLITIINAIFATEYNRVFNLTSEDLAMFARHLQRLDEGYPAGDDTSINIDDEGIPQFVKLNVQNVGNTILNRPISEIILRVVSDARNKGGSEQPTLLDIFQSSLFVVANSLTENILDDEDQQDELIRYAYRNLLGLTGPDEAATADASGLFYTTLQEVIRNDKRGIQSNVMKFLNINSTSGDIDDLTISGDIEDIDDALSLLANSHYYFQSGSALDAATRSTSINRIKDILMSLTFFTRKYFDDLDLVNNLNAVSKKGVPPNLVLSDYEEVKREDARRIIRRLFKTTNSPLENVDIANLDPSLLDQSGSSLNPSSLTSLKDMYPPSGNSANSKNWNDSDYSGSGATLLFDRIFGALQAITSAEWVPTSSVAGSQDENQEHLYLLEKSDASIGFAENDNVNVNLGICGGNVLLSNLINMEGADGRMYNKPTINKLALHMVVEYLSTIQQQVSPSQLNTDVLNYMKLVNKKYTDLSLDHAINDDGATRDVRDAICNSESDRDLIFEVLYSFYKRSFASTSTALGQGIAVEQLRPFGSLTGDSDIDAHIVDEPGFPIAAQTKFGSIEQALQSVFGQDDFEFNYN